MSQKELIWCDCTLTLEKRISWIKGVNYFTLLAELLSNYGMPMPSCHNVRGVLLPKANPSSCSLDLSNSLQGLAPLYSIGLTSASFLDPYHQHFIWCHQTQVFLTVKIPPCAPITPATATLSSPLLLNSSIFSSLPLCHLHSTKVILLLSLLPWNDPLLKLPVTKGQ